MSRNSLDKAVREIQKRDVVIYTIGPLSQENKRSAKNARKALETIAEAAGGLAFFLENVEDVHGVSEQVAHDIRNQYTLSYYPANMHHDGTFRTVSVDVLAKGRGRLTARTRNGYYAPNASTSDAAGN
jgi:Ca-activated chloride channel homolog